jgi:general secretion pathway protein C
MLAKRFSGIRPEVLARFALPVNLVLIVVLAHGLAKLTLRFLPRPDPITTPLAAGPDQPATGSEPSLPDYAAIADWHLFGEVNAAKPARTVVRAPETRLDLKLAGIFYAQPSGRALAIIAEGDGGERVYKVGEALAADVRLTEIQPDRVVLSRKGRLETLSLPRASGQLPAPASGAGDSGQAPMSRPTKAINAARVAKQLRNGASGRSPDLQELAVASPYMQDGQFRGLRLQQGTNPALLGQLGLRSGDVLVAVNGSRLDSPAQAVSALSGMFSADRVEALVLRNGHEVPFIFFMNGQ